MTSVLPEGPLTLGIHPDSRGFGWIAFSTPMNPYHWGLVGSGADKNARCRAKVEELIERLQPECLVLETFERHRSSRIDRITRLGRSIVALAQDRGIEVCIYSRRDVDNCFATVGARTRDEIAEAVARHIPVLKGRLPRRRRAWHGEDRRMALFSAAAVVLTHFRHQAKFFLDGLAMEC